MPADEDEAEWEVEHVRLRGCDWFGIECWESGGTWNRNGERHTRVRTSARSDAPPLPPPRPLPPLPVPLAPVPVPDNERRSPCKTRHCRAPAAGSSSISKEPRASCMRRGSSSRCRRRRRRQQLQLLSPLARLGFWSEGCTLFNRPRPGGEDRRRSCCFSRTHTTPARGRTPINPTGRDRFSATTRAPALILALAPQNERLD